MKKLFAVIISAMMLVTLVLPVCADGEDFVAEIGNISLPYGTPTIDGTVTPGEGWSEAKPYDKTSVDGGWGGEPVTIAGNLYRAYDEANLYIAADILIEEVAICEGEDWIDGGEYGNIPGWDGDCFILTFDPLNELLNQGFGSDTAAWYSFGIFEGGNIRVYRSHINDKEITDEVSAAGAMIDGGWRFEAAIPWNMICSDIEELSYGDVSLTPEDILAEGNEISTAFIYYDRRHDPEAEERITYSRYVSIATITADGMPGTLVTPWLINAYGIGLVVEAMPNTEGDITEDTTQGEDTTVPTDTGATVTTDSRDDGSAAPQDSTNAVSDSDTQAVDTEGEADNSTQGQSTLKPGDTTKRPASTTKPQSNSAPTGSSSAQTFDIGISIALGMLACSGVGIVSIKKRKQLNQKNIKMQK